VEGLMKKYNVHVTDVSTVEDAYVMMSDVARLTGTDASNVILSIKNSFSSLPVFKIKRALYLIWKKPWMTVGRDTFISEMMKVAGFQNVIGADRYPSLSEEDIRNLGPEVILLSSEPYPFKEQHVDELKKLLPSSQVMLVDGEMFSWYGSRMLKSANYFTALRTTFS
jgi:ABC-type Fe3+-hydroxamate transport system substrate-binding protein